MSSLSPDWPLIRQIIRIVHAAPGGGLHRAELAEAFHLPAYGESMKHALFVAYRRREIDFAGQYAVRPVKTTAGSPPAAAPTNRIVAIRK